MSGRFALEACYVASLGVGMDAETFARLFDPFSTTKRRSGGSWFGKHILYNLATGVPGGTLQIGGNPRRGRYRLRFHARWAGPSKVA